MGFLVRELKCRMVQKMVYSKIYKGHKPNEFEPWEKPDKTLLADGAVCHNDIQYGKKYPNSYFDLWLPNESEKGFPVFIYFHGGGFLFGDKSSGDPLAAGEAGSNKLKKIMEAGYAVVNANYALAPKYRFPVQIEQVDELMRYLIGHADELQLDMTRVCLSGGSAGAILTELYGVCVVNPEYAKQLGITSAMTMKHLKVLAIDEAATDTRTFNNNMYAMLLCWLGEKSKAYKGRHLLLNAKEHIKDRFIPSWINTSNRGEFFIREAVDLVDKLSAIGCDHDLVYFTKEQADLDHGYMDLMASNEYGRQAFERMMKFVGEHI